MGNRERIVRHSRPLMNAQGAHAIGTTQISDSLKISPGNLYYHFKNKEEIVRALFAELNTEFRAAIAEDVEPPISTSRFVAFYQRSLAVAWKYRFFYGGLLYLLRRDAQLAGEYRELQQWALAKLEQIARQLVVDGKMSKPRGSNGYQSLALNTWLIWSNWIRHVQITSVDHEINQADMVAGITQIFDVMSPYLTPEFDRAARRALNRTVVSD